MKSKKMVCKNKVRYGILDRKEVVYVTTSGKHKVEFIVDKDLWIGFLDKYNWTAMSKFNKYYIKFTGGQVIVFYSDQKTVFEYTDIDLNDLPVEQKCEVISGKEVKDDKALYDFLENYSS